MTEILEILKQLSIDVYAGQSNEETEKVLGILIEKVESLSLPSVIGSCTWDKLLEGDNLEHKDGYYCEECFYIGYHPNKVHTVYCPCCGRKINYR